VFASFTNEHAKNVAIWLAEVFGSPKQCSEEQGGHRTILEKHRGVRLTQPQKERWVQLMLETARETSPTRSCPAAFAEYIDWDRV